VILLILPELFQEGKIPMSAEKEDMHEKPVVQSRGKKFWMLTGIAGVIIVAALAILIFQGTGNNVYTLSPVTTGSPSHLQTSVTSYPQGGSTTRATGTFTAATTPNVPVDFILQSGEPTSCGLTCRQLDATITNTGYDTAHNVCITVTLHNSRNEVINLNGAPTLQRCIGDLTGGQAKTESISVDADCGAFATRCIGQTLTLRTQVSSDEKTAQFPDQIIPV